MKGNTGEIHLESEGGLYKYDCINHRVVVTKLKTNVTAEKKARHTGVQKAA